MQLEYPKDEEKKIKRQRLLTGIMTEKVNEHDFLKMR